MWALQTFSSSFLLSLVLQTSAAAGADTTPPILRIVEPITGTEIKGDTLTVEIEYRDTESGIAADKLRVLLDGKDYAGQFDQHNRGASGTIRVMKSLPTGEHRVTVEVADLAGNVAHAETLVKYVRPPTRKDTVKSDTQATDPQKDGIEQITARRIDLALTVGGKPVASADKGRLPVGVPVTLTATVAGLSPSEQPLYEFGVWPGNVIIEYGAPLQTSGQSTDPTWTWNAAYAGSHVKFSLTMKVQTSRGPVTRLIESPAYHIVDDIGARELWSSRIGPVMTFHRCASCHNPGDSPTQGDDRHTHVPAVTRETNCRQCHGETNGPSPGTPPGAPGHWRMPPPEFSFTNKSAAQICRQIKDPAQNGGRSLEDIMEHVRHDPIIRWTWNPGPGRTPSPFSWESIAFNTNSAYLTWVRLGAACPDMPTPPPQAHSESCCVTTPNTSLKGRLGRVIVRFPEAHRGTRVAISKDGKELLFGYGSQSWELLAGTYEVIISGKRLQNVTVKAGHDMNVRVGVLRILAEKHTRAAVLDSDGKELTSGYGNQMIGLPIGVVDVQVAGQTEQVTIRDGQVTDF